MKNLRVIRGSGGGGGGKGGGGSASNFAPTEAPNTWQTKAIARVIDIVSEGEISGLANGYQSIKFDGTPLQNPDGSFNFQGVSVATRNGTTDQTYVEGFPNVENEVDVGTEITQASPVIRAINNPEVDAIRLKIRVPQLTEQNTTTGDLRGSSVEFNIAVQPYGGSYANITGNYVWIETAGTVSSASATGVAASFAQQIYAKAGTDVTVTLSGQYKSLSAGVWTDFTSQTITKRIPNRNESTEGFESPEWIQVDSGLRDVNGEIIYDYYLRAYVSAWIPVQGLAIGQYQVQATGGNTILKFYSLDPTPFKIEEKNVAPAEASILVPLPEGGSPWSVKVTRVTADSTSSAIVNKTYWSTYTELIYAKVRYPDSALVALQVDASLFGNTVPRRSYDIKGIICQVPSNYTPSTRTYTGLWDGNFQNAWTDNPAWVLYNLLTNTRYGLGDFAPASKIDKTAFYTVAQYCDELVDDGYGGTEPRFTFNYCINSQESAFRVLNAVASAFRGMLYWGAGAVTVTQDSPRDTDAILAPANIIEGSLNYQGTAFNTRHSIARVTYFNPANGCKPEVLVVIDKETFKLSKKPLVTDIVAYGTTSRGQAYRFGKWILDSERTEGDVYQCRTSYDQIARRPGDIIELYDPCYAGVRFGGRLLLYLTWDSTSDLDVFYDTSSEIWADDSIWYCDSLIEIDQAITLVEGETYSLSCILPDGSVESKTVLNELAGATRYLYLEGTFSASPLKGSMWGVSGSNVEPRKFRILSVREASKGILELTGVFHDPDKYLRIESDVHLEAPNYSTLPKGRIEPVTNISFLEYLFQGTSAVRSAVLVSWQASASPNVIWYQLEVLKPNTSAYEFVALIKNKSYDYYDTIQGTYSFRVTPIDGSGKQGTSTVGSIEILGLLEDPSDVENFACNILDAQAHLSWDAVTDLDLSYYELRYSTLTTGATWGSAQPLVPQISPNATSVTVPSLVGTYLIKAVDTSGKESENATLIVSTVGNIALLNVVDTITESPAFAGVHDGTVVTSLGLQLDSADDMDTWADVDAVGNFDLGTSGFASQGTYTFASVVDLTEIYTSRVTASMEVSGYDVSDNMDLWEDVDAVQNWDGADPSQYSAKLQIRTTEDDPATSGATWTDWKDFVIGDYKARGIDLRVVLESLVTSVTPVVSSLVVTIDMPDRDISEKDITCTVAGYSASFSPAFKVLKAVVVTGQNMQTGDYFTISSKSETGFTIQFFDSADSPVERTFDFSAKGYGVVA